MYSFPSASLIRAPSPLAATIGSPPTPRKARTGELTPPGKRSRERDMMSFESSEASAAIAADRRRHGKRSNAPRCRPRGCRLEAAHNRRTEIVVVHDFRYRNVCKLAGGNGLIEERDTVDVVGLPWKTANGSACIVESVDQNSRRHSKARFVPISGYRPLQLSEALETLALQLLGNVVDHRRGVRAFLR